MRAGLTYVLTALMLILPKEPVSRALLLVLTAQDLFLLSAQDALQDSFYLSQLQRALPIAPRDFS